MDVNPQDLDIKGGTQPEIFRGTVEAMVHELKSDAPKFWRDTVARNGPIEIWEVNGERWLFNGNHRYQAAVLAGVEIPDSVILVVNKSGSSIPTYPLDQLNWLPGFK